jgi:hypothetical protein
MALEEARQARDAALRGLTGNAGVDHAVGQSVGLKPLFEETGPGFVQTHIVGGTETVPDDEDDRVF